MFSGIRNKFTVIVYLRHCSRFLSSCVFYILVGLFGARAKMELKKSENKF